MVRETIAMPVESKEQFDNHRVVMEFGGAPYSWIDRIDFSGSEKDVLAIDVNKDRSKLRRTHPERDNLTVEPMHVNITKREFLHDHRFDGGVDLLIANNMVGELYPIAEGPLLERLTQGYKNLRYGRESFTPTILRKFASMLREGGMAVIGQWNTPDFGDELFSMDDEAWAALGLERELITNADATEKLLSILHVSEEEKRRVVAYFGSHKTAIPPFILVLKKKTLTERPVVLR